MSTANYYNKRDKNGRFTSKKKKGTVGIVNTVKKKKTNNKGLEIYDMFILDKSSSMQSIRQETINGFNEVLNGIKSVHNDTKVPSYCSLIEFSSNGTEKVVYSNSLCENVNGLNNDNYRPSGMTALYDAIGFGINNMIQTLGSKIMDKKISVTITIQTDGEENHSSKYNRESIKRLIEEVRDTYNWTINYIGAGEDWIVKAVADNIGIFSSNTMSYMANSTGTTDAFRKMSKSRATVSTAYVNTGEVKNSGFFSDDK